MNIGTLYVHAGKFHADDVLTAALCQLAFGNCEVKRVMEVTSEMRNDESAIIADIGYGKYDHHQPDCERRSDGTPYAACGLVFRDIWQYLFPNEYFARRFMVQYIRPIELHDNGIKQNPLSIAINSYVPLKDSSPENMDACFLKAVEFMKSVVRNEVERVYAQESAFTLIMEYYENSSDKNIVVLDKYIPAIERLIPTQAKYLLFPSNRGGWNLQTVPKAVGEYGNKEDLPVEWIKEKPQGCSFVHKDLFLAAFDSKEEALNALYASRLYAMKAQAKVLINDYCQREFGHDADFSNTELIPMGYGKTMDGDYEIQLFVDIENYRFLKYETWGNKQKLFASISDLNDVLIGMTYGDFVSSVYDTEKRAAK